MQFRLPDVGEGIAESVLRKWHVVPGQTITEDDRFCDIETDKAVVEIPSPCDGIVLSLDVREGTTVTVGAVIAQVEPRAPADSGVRTEIKASTSAGHINPEPRAAGADAGAAEKSEGRAHNVPAAPSVRRMARELGVDMSQIQGSGPRGRVLRRDVEEAESGKNQTPQGIQRPVTPRSDLVASERVPMTPLQWAIAERMRRSLEVIPHATSTFRCDATAFVELREQCEKKLGHRISYTAMLMKALVPALKACPYFNASLDDAKREVVLHQAYNVGFATATESGLIVPVVKDVDRKTLLDISKEIATLAAAARSRTIGLSDLRGATITLSNLGSHGGHEVSGRPVIDHPQVAVIAATRIRPEPAVYQGAVVARQTLGITASYDHRLIDGAYASACIERMIEIIERPALLMAYA